MTTQSNVERTAHGASPGARSEPKPYRTLFVATLVQDSALAVGGRDVGGLVDAPLARDGQGHLTLRGTTLTGALVESARRVLGFVPPTIAGVPRPGPKSTQPEESAWRVFHAHPEAPSSDHPTRVPVTELRQSVALRRDTGAAAPGALHDTEVVPVGTRWRLLVEVDTFRAPDAARVAALALREWEEGRCWLGRDVARGMGWCHVEGPLALALDTTHVDAWPRSSKRPLETVDDLLRCEGRKDQARKHFEALCAPSKTTQKPAPRSWYVEAKFSIAVGQPPEGASGQYGLDALSVGGQGGPLAAVGLEGHLCHPRSLAWQQAAERLDPDHAFAVTRPSETGAPEPLLPGAGLRGALRAALEGMTRPQRKPPAEQADAPVRAPLPEVQTLFGTLDTSARLLVRDAHLVRSEQGQPAWSAAWLHHHAEDEFSQGPFESSLFNRLVLVEGKFEARLVIEADDEGQARRLWRTLAPALHLAQEGHVPLGAGRWRGLGWVRWQCTKPVLGRAGAWIQEAEKGASA